MPATPLGSDALKALLAGHGHLLVANRTDAEDGVTIVAAAVARHVPAGAKTETVFNLELEAEESVGLDPLVPLTEDPELVEVLLRVHLEATGEVVDAYVSLKRPGGESSVTFEAGVKRNSGILEEGEEVLGEDTSFVVYGLPAGEM
jgi:hypothetical protein